MNSNRTPDHLARFDLVEAAYPNGDTYLAREYSSDGEFMDADRVSEYINGLMDHYEQAVMKKAEMESD